MAEVSAAEEGVVEAPVQKTVLRRERAEMSDLVQEGHERLCQPMLQRYRTVFVLVGAVAVWDRKLGVEKDQ